MAKEYDALFIHGQGYHPKPGRKNVPSVRGRLGSIAVDSLLKSGYTFDNYLFSGIAFGKDLMPMAQVTARDVHRRAGVSPDDMTIDETARTTSMEVAFSAKEAREKGYNRVAHLTYGEVHADQVKDHASVHYPQGVEVDVFRADDILTGAFDPDILITLGIAGFVSKYNNSDQERKITNYEMPKNTFMGWRGDLGNKVLNLLSKFYRPDPTQN